MEKKIRVEAEGKEEYWGQEHKCPYCGDLRMHGDHKFCSECGKSFENVEFICPND